MKLIEEARSGAQARRKFSAQEVRSAARRFSNKTSTGSDGWSLKEIALTPDPVLVSLAGIVSDMRDTTVPPLQTMLNIMASIPKKDGGSRTVAIATTLYRLLMEMDNEEVAEFEAKNAYQNDSAAAGASAVAAAEDRAVEAELARLSGLVTISTLWDLRKFFDSIDIEVLIQLARDLGFPLKQLAVSLIVHQAPRRLKLGKALGDCISNLGRSILAGCKRSTHFARVYLLKMVRQLAEAHPDTSLYLHVDDISNLTKGGSQKELSDKAFKWASDFKDWTIALKLDISEKSVVVPVCKAAEVFTKRAVAANIPMQMKKEGVDIGVDTSSATARTVTKQLARIEACSSKAKRASFLSKRNKKARKLAITAVKPAQLYGHTAVGMSPSCINKCKANITEATGMAGANACSTSILAWAFRKKQC